MTEGETRSSASSTTERARPILVRRGLRPIGSRIIRGVKAVGFSFKRILKSISVWSKRKRDDLILDGLIAFLVLSVAFVLDGRIADRQNELSLELASASEVQENTRFIRQVALIDGAVVRPFSGLNLQGAALAGLDLGCEVPADGEEIGAGSVLTGDRPDGCTDLTNANLTGAALSNTDLAGAILFNTRLVGAILFNTDLTDADLMVADLTDADLTVADLDRANLDGATLTDADLFDADLFDANLTDANLTFADLTGANLTGANLTGANLTGANLTGANLTGANLTFADLTGADLTGANLTGANLTHVAWERVCYRGTSLPQTYTPPSPPTCD